MRPRSRIHDTSAKREGREQVGRIYVSGVSDPCQVSITGPGRCVGEGQPWVGYGPGTQHSGMARQQRKGNLYRGKKGRCEPFSESRGMSFKGRGGRGIKRKGYICRGIFLLLPLLRFPSPSPFSFSFFCFPFNRVINNALTQGLLHTPGHLCLC